MSDDIDTQVVNKVTLRPDGPLILKGDIEVVDSEGGVVSRDSDVALCRCGQSKNMPFCDSSHKTSGFVDSGQFQDEKSEPITTTGKLVIQCRTNAMLLAKGPMKISSQDGKSVTTRNKAALCRCGHSNNKPFCDARHKQSGFESK